MGRWRGLLFDLGSTLMVFNGAWPEVFAQADASLLAALQQGGMILDGEKFKAEVRARLLDYHEERESEFIEHTTGYVLRTALAQFGYPDPPDALIEQALARMYAVSQAYWQPEADALPTLAALQQRGIRMGIISNAGDDQDVQTLVDKGGFRPYMDFILSSASCGVRKPNPKIFRMALDHWDLRLEEVAMVGDTLGADILGAQHAGISSIWITRRADTPGNRAHADTIQPDVSIPSLAALVEVVGNG